MTIKEILDEVMLQSGMPTETEYTTSDDDSIKRVATIASSEASRLTHKPWQKLRKTYEFTLTTSTQYSLPDDFRAFVPDTMYTDSHLWAVDFPTDQSEWAYLQSSTGGTGTRVKVRLLGGKLQVYQPTSGETIRFEYWSNAPVLAADGVTYKQKFTADTDTFVLDDELLVHKTIAAYKRLMGLEWQYDQQEADSMERVLLGQDRGAQTIRPGSDPIGEPYYDLYRPVPNVTS